MKKTFLSLMTAGILLGSCPTRAIDVAGFWNTYKQPLSWLIAGVAVVGGFLGYAYHCYCQEKNPSFQVKPPQSGTVYDRIAGSMIAGAVGDALGRPTEFIKSVDDIFRQYPWGIQSFNDFKQKDFKQGIAPYTDDTAMTMVTADVLVNAYKNDLELTMGQLACAYVQDMFQKDGWAASYRAPGETCKKNVALLAQQVVKPGMAAMWAPEKKAGWWRISKPGMNEGGCGSVMHAHPFGLIFAYNPEKAVQWAAEHSYLTHGAPIAVAACAAMAGGTAYAVQGKNPDEITQYMMSVARRYDTSTADAMSKAYAYAHDHKNQIAKAGQIVQRDPNSLSFTLAKPVYEEFLGWDARTAIAATVYTFLMAPDSTKTAIYYGVHTPGDSDSIASMAGALVGARVGYNRLMQEWPELKLNKLEGYSELMNLSLQMVAGVPK